MRSRIHGAVADRRDGNRAPLRAARADRRLPRRGVDAADREIERGDAHSRAALSTRPELTPNEQLLTARRQASRRSGGRSAIRQLAGCQLRASRLHRPHRRPVLSPTIPGARGKIHGWEKLQWNFLAKDGVNAPEAWSNLLADHRPGAKGVVIAVVDTGVAFRNWKTFKRSPDFRGHQVRRSLRPGRRHRSRTAPAPTPIALDREGHGTFVAGEIAEATNNNYGADRPRLPGDDHAGARARRARATATPRRSPPASATPSRTARR